MPIAPPPACFDGQPNRYLLARGTCLWRVHTRPYSAWSFKVALADDPPDDAGGTPVGGARFDSSSGDRYPYYYAALDESTALAETLLRNLPPNEQGKRLLVRSAITGRRLSGLALTRDLQLVSLISGQDLAAVGQDAWLVTAATCDYSHTRQWAHWLRRQAKWAHGFVWSSLRNPGGSAIVLFGDRCAADFGAGYEHALLHEVTELAVDLDDEVGTLWLNDKLAPYRVLIPPARPQASPLSC